MTKLLVHNRVSSFKLTTSTLEPDAVAKRASTGCHTWQSVCDKCLHFLRRPCFKTAPSRGIELLASGPHQNHRAEIEPRSRTIDTTDVLFIVNKKRTRTRARWRPCWFTERIGFRVLVQSRGKAWHSSPLRLRLSTMHCRMAETVQWALNSLLSSLSMVYNLIPHHQDLGCITYLSIPSLISLPVLFLQSLPRRRPTTRRRFCFQHTTLIVCHCCFLLFFRHLGGVFGHKDAVPFPCSHLFERCISEASPFISSPCATDRRFASTSNEFQA